MFAFTTNYRAGVAELSLLEGGKARNIALRDIGPSKNTVLLWKTLRAPVCMLCEQRHYRCGDHGGALRRRVDRALPHEALAVEYLECAPLTLRHAAAGRGALAALAAGLVWPGRVR